MSGAQSNIFDSEKIGLEKLSYSCQVAYGLITSTALSPPAIERPIALAAKYEVFLTIVGPFIVADQLFLSIVASYSTVMPLAEVIIPHPATRSPPSFLAESIAFPQSPISKLLAREYLACPLTFLRPCHPLSACGCLTAFPHDTRKKTSTPPCPPSPCSTHGSGCTVVPDLSCGSPEENRAKRKVEPGGDWGWSCDTRRGGCR